MKVPQQYIYNIYNTYIFTYVTFFNIHIYISAILFIFIHLCIHFKIPLKPVLIFAIFDHMFSRKNEPFKLLSQGPSEKWDYTP